MVLAVAVDQAEDRLTERILAHVRRWMIESRDGKGTTLAETARKLGYGNGALQKRLDRTQKTVSLGFADRVRDRLGIPWDELLAKSPADKYFLPSCIDDLRWMRVGDPSQGKRGRKPDPVEARSSAKPTGQQKKAAR